MLSLSYKTLVELDLSNALIGYNGALVIAKHLSSVPVKSTVADSSHEIPPMWLLSSLRLAGNAMGDLGIQAITSALQVILHLLVSYVTCMLSILLLLLCNNNLHSETIRSLTWTGHRTICLTLGSSTQL